jgi:hypothetical protein
MGRRMDRTATGSVGLAGEETSSSGTGRSDGTQKTGSWVCIVRPGTDPEGRRVVPEDTPTDKTDAKAPRGAPGGRGVPYQPRLVRGG